MFKGFKGWKPFFYGLKGSSFSRDVQFWCSDAGDRSLINKAQYRSSIASFPPNLIQRWSCNKFIHSKILKKLGHSRQNLREEVREIVHCYEFHMRRPISTLFAGQVINTMIWNPKICVVALPLAATKFDVSERDSCLHWWLFQCDFPCKTHRAGRKMRNMWIMRGSTKQ